MSAAAAERDPGSGWPLAGVPSAGLPSSRAVPSGVVVLTDRWVARRALVDVVAGAVRGGVRWVVLREKDLARAERLALAVELRAVLAEAGGTLIVAGPDPLDGDAVHLPAAGPYPPPPLGLVGRSCHDGAELARLTTEDYVTLSPVFVTRSKPGYGPPLGRARLAELIKASPVPALALGGIETPDQVSACVEAGVAGVAVLGALMHAEDPTAAAATLGGAFEAAAAQVARNCHLPTEVPTTGQPPTATREGEE